MNNLINKIHDIGEGGRLKLHSSSTSDFSSEKNLLQIPGAWTGKKAYEKQSECLAKEGINTYTLELSGHGQSEIPEGKRFGTLTLDDYVEDVHTAVNFIINKEGAAPDCTGHSMGALTLLRYLNKYDDLKKAILLAPGDVFRATLDYLKQYRFQGGINLIKSLFSFDLHELISDSQVASELLFSRRIKDIQNIGEFCGSESLLAFLDMIANSYRDIEKVRKKIQNNELIVWILYGASDNIFNSKQPEKMARDLGISDKVIMYPEASHYLMHDPRKEEVFSDIARIVKEK